MSNQHKPSSRFQLGSLLIAALALMFSPAQAFAGGKAHQHGYADMQLTVSAGGQVKAVMKGAMDGFLGFEHRPKTDAQRTAVKALRELTEQAGAMLAMPAAAACVLQSTDAQSLLFTEPPAGGGKEKHADLSWTQTFQCAAPAALFDAQGIPLAAFQRFPRLRTVNLSFALESPPQGVQPTGARKLSPRQAPAVLFR